MHYFVNSISCLSLRRPPTYLPTSKLQKKGVFNLHEGLVQCAKQISSLKTYSALSNTFFPHIAISDLTSFAPLPLLLTPKKDLIFGPFLYSPAPRLMLVAARKETGSRFESGILSRGYPKRTKLAKSLDMFNSRLGHTCVAWGT